MLKEYVTSKSVFTWRVLTSDLDSEMIQDAMGIILCPSWSTDAAYPALARRHFKTWKTKTFPNPLGTHADRLTNELDKLYSRLLLFIEDYLTKATAIFPPRELLCLPGLSLWSCLTFKGQTVATRFDAADLTYSERRRLLKAFLRFELMCKTREYWYDFRTHSSLPFMCKGPTFQHSEQEAVHCVHEYLKSLYGAIFAHCGDAWLPDLPEGSLSCRTNGLLYSDSLYVNADLYASDLGLQHHYSSKSSVLASKGFDTIMNFLRCASTGQLRRDTLKGWIKDIRKAGRSCFGGFGDLYPDDKSVAVEDGYDQGCSGMYKLLYPRISGSFAMHFDIYRQRAWAFLEDARLYPCSAVGPHFPTFDELGEQMDEIKMDQEWFSKPAHTRALHRSQKWHDERDLRDAHDSTVREELRGSEEKSESRDTPPSMTTEDFVFQDFDTSEGRFFTSEDVVPSLW